jgi:hypothetical protein
LRLQVLGDGSLEVRCGSVWAFGECDRRLESRNELAGGPVPFLWFLRKPLVQLVEVGLGERGVSFAG